MQFDLFEQFTDAYRRDYGDISDDLEKIIDRIIDDMAEVQARLKDKEIELTVHLTLRQEYEQITEDITQRIDSIETRMQSFHETDFRQHLDAFKVGTETGTSVFPSFCFAKDLSTEIHVHRSSIERLQILSTSLSAQLTDTSDRDRVRQRVNDITRRWAKLEQEIVSEEETLDEMRVLTDLFDSSNAACQRWLTQTRDLIEQLSNGRHVELLDQVVPRAKTTLFEYQTCLENLQRLRTRLNRLTQTTKTPVGIQKVRSNNACPCSLARIFCLA